MAWTIASPQAGTDNEGTGGIVWRRPLVAVVSFSANVWQKFRAGIWGIRNKLNSGVAKPLDIEQIATQLAVVKRGTEDGRRNLPSAEEEVPSGTQREFISYFTSLRRRARQQVAEAAEKSSRTFEKIRLSESLAKLRDIPAACDNKILRCVADFESRLAISVEREQKQKRHYDAFRERNGLERLAYYPGTAYHYYLVVPALIVAVAFALTNLIETRAGGDAGVSVAWVVTFSAAAVIVPFMLGDWWLRLINHIDEFKTFLGWIGAIVAIAATLGVAFYTDFHIAAALDNPNASIRDVFVAMLAAPIDVVSSVASWKVFGLVAVVGLFAMLLGYRSDDPYPGYGAAQRAYYKTRGARDEGSAELRKRINTLIDEAEAEIAAIVKGSKNQVRAYTTLVEQLQQNSSTLSDYDVELEEACNTVLDRYRVANAAARQSESPMSFAEHVCFNAEGETDARQHLDGSARVDELRRAIVELENEEKLARQNLRALNVRMINFVSEPHSFDLDLTA